MKHVKTSWIFALLAIALAGCDHGKEPLAKGADAEVTGNLVEAVAQYRAVCEAGSSLCPIATRRLEQIKLDEARKALASGDWKKAKAAIDIAADSTDAGVKRAAAEVMRKLPDLEKGLAWEEALASSKPEEALATMEGLAAAGFLVSPKAREWLEKNRPRILLDRIKAACSAQGVGACAELGRDMVRLHPTSPESAEARALVDADYARLFPRLQEAENLIGQEVMIYEREKKISWCALDNLNSAEGREGTLPDAFRAECETLIPAVAMPTADFLHNAWEKKIAEIHDPTFTKPLEERMLRATNEGLHDPEAWPKPAGKK
jgi:hypothetical protein